MMNAWILLIATLATASASAIPVENDINDRCDAALEGGNVQAFILVPAEAGQKDNRKYYIQCFKNEQGFVSGRMNRCAPCTVFSEKQRGCVHHRVLLSENIENLELEVREPVMGRCGSYSYCGMSDDHATECCDPLYRFDKDNIDVVFKRDQPDDPCVPDKACNETCELPTPSTTVLPKKTYEKTCEKNFIGYFYDGSEAGGVQCYLMLNQKLQEEQALCCPQGAKFDTMDCTCKGAVYEKTNCLFHVNCNFGGIDDDCRSNWLSCSGMSKSEDDDGALSFSSTGFCSTYALSGVDNPKTISIFTHLPTIEGVSTLISNGACDTFNTLEISINDGTVIVRLGYGGQMEDKYLKTEPSSIEAGKWYHVCLTGDGKDQILYLNGEKQASVSAPNVAGKSKLEIGGQECWGGYRENPKDIDEVTLLDKCLSAESVKMLYEQGRP